MEAPLHESGDRRARHQHALVHVQLESGEKGAPGEVRKRYAFGHATLQQFVDPPAVAQRQRPQVRARAGLVGDTGGEEHQLRRFIARVVGAVPEVHAGPSEHARAACDGRADGFHFRHGFLSSMG